jgi:hypothetical protein
MRPSRQNCYFFHSYLRPSFMGQRQLSVHNHHPNRPRTIAASTKRRSASSASQRPAWFATFNAANRDGEQVPEGQRLGLPTGPRRDCD